MKETLVLNFDFILDENNQLFLLEAGSGLTRAGFDGYNKLHPQGTMQCMVIKKLLEHFSNIHVISNDRLSEELLGLNNDVLAGNRRVDFKVKKEFAFKKGEFAADDLVILDNSFLPNIHPFHLAAIFAANNISTAVANDGNLWRLMLSKSSFYQIVSQCTENALPKTVPVNLNNLAICQEALQQLNSEYLILKPTEGCRAAGVVIIKREQLDAVFSYLRGETKNFVESQELKTRLRELKERIDDFFIPACIVQEFISAKPIAIDGQHYRPTGRIVVCGVVHDDNSFSFEVIDAYYKLPMKPIERKEINWHESVSYSLTNIIAKQHAEVQRGVSAFLAPATFVDQQGKASALIPENDMAIIKMQAEKKIMPVMLYLLNNSVFSLLKEPSTESDYFREYYCKTMDRFSYYNLTMDEIDYLHERGVNVLSLLINYIYQFISGAQVLKSSTLIPWSAFDILKNLDAEYISCDQSSNDELLEQINEVAKKLLAFAPSFRSEVENAMLVLVQIEDLLQNSELLPYRLAVSLYGQRCYKEAIEKFKIAVSKPISKKQEAKVHFLLACCYEGIFQYGSAIISVNKALACYSKLNNCNNKIEVAQAKLSQLNDKKVGHGLFNNAALYFKDDKYDQAKDMYLQAIDLHEKHNKISEPLAIYYYNLSSCYDHLDDGEKAIENCEKSVEIRIKLFGISSEKTVSAQEKLANLIAKAKATEKLSY